MRKIPVLEIFGPTIQGEGMVIGQKTMFVRTAGCDYSCSWCDSKFTWDGSEKESIQMMEPQEIVEALYEKGGGRFQHVT
ncbi:7-carboxy-7-deazaguanine synthase QueE, partial [Herbaspirillum sp. VT-16-41]